MVSHQKKSRPKKSRPMSHPFPAENEAKDRKHNRTATSSRFLS
jgi:hypothetical protein